MLEASSAEQLAKLQWLAEDLSRTDDEVEAFFGSMTVAGEYEISAAVRIIDKYRPLLSAELARRLAHRRSDD